ncbi:hypothetical protein T484DRAFT_1768663 [Baffinella frigidus]|nr:hypothetical protein T484DRAFT_1768663 [Cryptophyta sp. CCMP2293]
MFENILDPSRGSRFDAADLSGFNISASLIRPSSFQNTKCGGSDLTSATIERSTLVGADFSASDFSGARISHNDFGKGNLSAVNFRQAQTNECSFRDATLEKVRFQGADLQGNYTPEQPSIPI